MKNWANQNGRIKRKVELRRKVEPRRTEERVYQEERLYKFKSLAWERERVNKKESKEEC